MKRHIGWLLLLACAGAGAGTGCGDVSTGSPTFTVTFDSRGGSTVPAQAVVSNALAKAPADPARTGHVFGGWYREPACTTAWTFATDPVRSDLTLHAKWMEIFTVSFDSAGGSEVPDQAVASNALASEPAAPVRAGYQFGGWYREPGCLTNWAFATDAVAGHTVLYARWLMLFTLTFDSLGGRGVPDQEIVSNGLASMPGAPTLSGYTFYGWFKEPGCLSAWSFATDRVTTNLTVYAKWIVNRSWRAIASSSDGQRLAAVAMYNSIFLSADSGASWTGREDGRLWWSIACSSDGSRLVALEYGGHIHTSTDFGTNWVARDTNRS